MVPATLNNTATMIIQGILFSKYTSSLCPPQMTTKLKMTTSNATEESLLGSKSESALGLEECGLFFFSNFNFSGLHTHFTTTIENCP